MIIINTSFHVHVSLVDDFKTWVKDIYIPEALASGMVSTPRFMTLLIEVQEDCVSFAVSFEADTIEYATRWHDSDGAKLRDQLRQKFGDGVLNFSTYMDELPLN